MILNAEQVRQILPHDYPFIMIDGVTEFVKGERLTAFKNITGSEWVFEGHRCETHNFSETLLIEAAAQAGLIFYALNFSKNKVDVLLGKVKSTFESQFGIGDVVEFRIVGHKFILGRGFINVEIIGRNQKCGEVEVFTVTRPTK